MVRPVTEDLLDDLAYQIHDYLMENSTEFHGNHLVLLPTTAIVKKFERNHRTIDRRLKVLKKEGLIELVIRKDFTSLYWVKELEDD